MKDFISFFIHLNIWTWFRYTHGAHYSIIQSTCSGIVSWQSISSSSDEAEISWLSTPIRWGLLCSSCSMSSSSGSPGISMLCGWEGSWRKTRLLRRWGLGGRGIGGALSCWFQCEENYLEALRHYCHEFINQELISRLKLFTT